MKIILTLLLCLLIFSRAGAQDSPTLFSIQSRGQLICGVDEQVYGFGFLNPNTGGITGIQIDFCRAVAAAVLGEAEAVDLRLHSLDAPTADLTSGELDLLFQHNVNDSLVYASQPDLDFGAATYFYDGASVMVRANSGMNTWEGLADETVCAITAAPTTVEFQAEMERRNLEFELLENETIAEMRASFFNGRCLAQLLDRSLLEIIRNSQEDPQDYEVWPTPFTLRPLNALYRHHDERWGEIVDAIIWGLIYAEEIGVSSENVDDLLRLSQDESDEDYLERVGTAAYLLDSTLGLGTALGLSNDFMLEVIRQVGNYGEIYERHLGPETAIHIERGLNDLWIRGGLLDAPGWR